MIRTQSGAKAQFLHGGCLRHHGGAGVPPGNCRLSVVDPDRDRRRAVSLSRGLVRHRSQPDYQDRRAGFSSWRPTPPLSGCEAPTGTRSWAPFKGGVCYPGFPVGVSSNLPTVPGLVRLQSRQFTQVLQALPPSAPQTLTPEILRILEKLMDTGLTDGGLGFRRPLGGTGTQYRTPLTIPGARSRMSCSKLFLRCSRPRIQTPAPVQTPSAPIQHGPVSGAHSFNASVRLPAGIMVSRVEAEDRNQLATQAFHLCRRGRNVHDP